MEERIGQNASLSWIYYINQPGNFSHTELEIDGTAWTLLCKWCDECKSKPLESMIQKSKNGKGWPFFRFVLKATPKQTQEIKNIIDEKKGAFGLTCAFGALYPLSQVGVCNVPMPIKAFPTFSALYLLVGKKLALNNVSEIKYYGGQSLKKDIYRTHKGPLRECIILALFCYMFWLGSYTWSR